MPQMKPMNWLLLFLYFTIMFILMNSNLHFLIMKNLYSMKLMMSSNKSKFFNKLVKNNMFYIIFTKFISIYTF